MRNQKSKPIWISSFVWCIRLCRSIVVLILAQTRKSNHIQVHVKPEKQTIYAVQILRINNLHFLKSCSIMTSQHNRPLENPIFGPLTHSYTHWVRKKFHFKNIIYLQHRWSADLQFFPKFVVVSSGWSTSHKKEELDENPTTRSSSNSDKWKGKEPSSPTTCNRCGKSAMLRRDAGFRAQTWVKSTKGRW